MTKVEDSIRNIINPSLCSTMVYDDYLQRLSQGQTTRDENIASHFCVYFLPYNPLTLQVFITHHKKAGLWITTGGHIDKGETLLETLEREMLEELGMIYKASHDFKPFFMSITTIENQDHPCKKHYDLWYGIETDGSNFIIDPSEFYETRWLTIPEAQMLVIDRANLEALDRIEKTVFHQPR